MFAIGEKAQAALDKMIEAFDNPSTIVDTLKRAALLPNDSPSRKWSFHNRILVAIANTNDARGYRQWESVGRHVIAGRHAFHRLC